jgi:alkaline phosphatase/alkaline phosphatase D
MREGEEFFAWLGKNGFLAKNTFIICGDRHWQYHAAHPSASRSSRAERLSMPTRAWKEAGRSGIDRSGALITQFYTQRRHRRLSPRDSPPGADGGRPEAEFAFFDEKGVPLYSTVKAAKM